MGHAISGRSDNADLCFELDSDSFSMRRLWKSALSEKEILDLLRDEVGRAGSQSAWCRHTGISRTFLVKVLRGQQHVSPPILKALKIKIIYLRRGKVIDLGEAIQFLQAEVRRVGGPSAWARKTHVGRSHLSRVLHGKKGIGPRLLTKLNITRAYIREGD